MSIRTKEGDQLCDVAVARLTKLLKLKRLPVMGVIYSTSHDARTVLAENDHEMQEKLVRNVNLGLKLFFSGQLV